MLWNWQLKNWPKFIYHAEELQALENQFLQNSGKLLGSLHYIDAQKNKQFSVDLIGNEAYYTSEIEGEILNRDSLRSSIARHLGLISTHEKIPPAENGIASMMLAVLRDYKKSLSHSMLFSWHTTLLPMQWRVRVGAYRTHAEPMQVVSGAHHAKVHYQAPPSKQVPKEMQRFIQWFNNSGPSGKQPLPALARAAIAHLYFVIIHPFEDGNGRIARAIAQKALMQTLEQPFFILLSQVIQNHKKNYYAKLQKTNRSIEITEWMDFFSKTILEAQKETQAMISFLIAKTTFFAQFQHLLNARQEKVLQRMFKEGIKGFEGGLSAKNYMTIAKTSASTATRDLADLVAKKILSQQGELKYTRYFLCL